jgi:hypothetical protein
VAIAVPNLADSLPERRTSTPIGSTAGIPAGTLVCVPAAPPTGPVPSGPVVAVNVTPFWKSIEPYILIIGLPVADAVAEYVLSILDGGAFNASTLKHIVITTAVGAYLAWRRKRVNEVLS